MIGRLSGGGCPVMTRCACTGYDTGVAKCCGLPGGGAVTAIAGLRGWQMIGCLAGGSCPVVAGRAGARNYAGMVERCGLPRGGAMAGVACQRGR